jgi:hypothetical protein
MVLRNSWAIVALSRGKRGGHAALAGFAGDRCPRIYQAPDEAPFVAGLHGMLADETDAGDGP